MGCTENKPNPYSGVGNILSDCLDYVANNSGDVPPYEPAFVNE